MAPGRFCLLLLLALVQHLECLLISRFGGGHIRREEPLPELHPFHVQSGACYNRDFKDLYKTTMRASTCSQPLDAFVRLVSDDDAYQFFPSHVKVKRCGGSCSAAQSCLPSQNETMTVSVRRMNRISGEMTCGTVEVEQHTKCMCKCSVMPHHCNKALQEYKENDCMCECLNAEEMDDCLTEGKIWNTNTCNCECEQTQECSTGLDWVPSHCSCMKVSH